MNIMRGSPGCRPEKPEPETFDTPWPALRSLLETCGDTLQPSVMIIYVIYGLDTKGITVPVQFFPAMLIFILREDV